LLIVVILQSAASAQEGTLEWGEITSAALGGATKKFVVYLPPSYHTSEKRYPAVYGLHGSGGHPATMTGGWTTTADRMTRNGDIGEMIAVFPDGDNSWYTGAYEPYITKDLVDHVDAHYRTIPDRNSRGITGASMGGFGAMHLALKFPEVFAVAEGQAGAYSGGLRQQLDRYVGQPVRLNGIQIVHGTADAMISVSAARALAENLTDLGIDHVYVEHSGGHVMLLEESLSFFSDHLHPLHEIGRLREAISATTTPGTVVVGKPTALEVTVMLDVPPEVRGIFLDLSSLGIPSELPLEPSEGGGYTVSHTITPFWSGRFPLLVMMETAFEWDLEDARYRLLTVELVVYPGADEYYFYQDEMGAGWEVEVTRGESDLKASAVHHSGSYSHAVTLESGGGVKYAFADPDGFSTLGYTTLEFWIHPGTSSIEQATLVLRTAEAVHYVKLGYHLGITLQPDVWEAVSIPLEDLELVDTPLKYIQLRAVKGTFYIDDLGLFVVEYGLSEAAATPQKVKADGTMSTLLTVQTVSAVKQPGAPPTVTVDLTPLGGASETAMLDDGTRGDHVAGDGMYSLRTTVESEVQNGIKELVVTSTDHRLRLVRTPLEVGVIPAQATYLYQDEVEEGWNVRLYRAEMDPTSTDYVYDGSYACAVTFESGGQLDYQVEDPDGLPAFGYVLEFWLNPGSASIEELKVVAAAQEGTKVLPLAEQWGLSFDAERWQRISIPLAALELTDIHLEWIRFTGDTQGTFYVDDIRLVPEEVIDTAVEAVSEAIALPSGYSLSQNYPNPFNSRTTIQFSLPQPETVELTIYNLAGQQVATLVSGEHQAGTYTVNWNGKDDRGNELASGVYLYRLRAGDGEQVETRKLVLIR